MSLVSKKKPTVIGGPGLDGCHDDHDEECTADIVMISKDQQQQQQQLNRFLSSKFSSTDANLITTGWEDDSSDFYRLETFHMVNNKDVDVVSWSPKGDSSFVIKDIEEFSKVRTQSFLWLQDLEKSKCHDSFWNNHDDPYAEQDVQPISKTLGWPCFLLVCIVSDNSSFIF